MNRVLILADGLICRSLERMGTSSKLLNELKKGRLTLNQKRLWIIESTGGVNNKKKTTPKHISSKNEVPGFDVEADIVSEFTAEAHELFNDSILFASIVHVSNQFLKNSHLHHVLSRLAHLHLKLIQTVCKILPHSQSADSVLKNFKNVEETLRHFLIEGQVRGDKPKAIQSNIDQKRLWQKSSPNQETWFSRKKQSWLLFLFCLKASIPHFGAHGDLVEVGLLLFDEKSTTFSDTFLGLLSAAFQETGMTIDKLKVLDLNNIDQFQTNLSHPAKFRNWLHQAKEYKKGYTKYEKLIQHCENIMSFRIDAQQLNGEPIDNDKFQFTTQRIAVDSMIQSIFQK